jgi:hypothetical protein
MTIGHPVPSIEGPATFSSREEPLMTSHPVHRPASPLRARMIEDMSVRGFDKAALVSDRIARSG